VKLVDDVPVPSGFVTAIGPAAAPVGTVAVICVSESTVKTAVVPLNVTVVVPVNPVPTITTLVPIEPLVGENDVTVGTAANAGNAVIAIHRTTSDDEARTHWTARRRNISSPSRC
jgi:hypothetical protein